MIIKHLESTTKRYQHIMQSLKSDIRFGLIMMLLIYRLIIQFMDTYGMLFISLMFCIVLVKEIVSSPNNSTRTGTFNDFCTELFLFLIYKVTSCDIILCSVPCQKQTRSLSHSLLAYRLNVF